MLDQLLPPRIDNTYRGHRLALWLFGLVVSVRIIQSLVVIFNGYSTARSADGIPLDAYPLAAAQTMVALFALAGLSRLIIALLCVLVLARYRGAVPFMFAVLAVSHLASQLLLHFVPIVRTGTPPGPVVNLTMFALVAVGLALSLRRRESLEGRPSVA
jgi:MYXO-CTERM domain-containing protein